MSKVAAAIVGFLAASLIPALMFAVLTPVSGRFDLPSMLGLFTVGYFFSAMATILFGLPAFFLIHYFRLIRWWSTLAAGCAVGAIVAIIVRLPNRVEVNDLLVMCAMGTAAAFAFWLVWRNVEKEPVS
jgi:uncharacterized membrane protein YvlD (DUF360 family)